MAIATPEQGRHAVDSLAGRGVDFIKIQSGVPHDAYLAIAGEAQARGIQFEGHVPDAVRASEAIVAGQRSFEHLIGIFEAFLRLLSPFMPFITEEIWHAVYDGKPPLKSIALTAYPQVDEKQVDTVAETEMAILQDLIVACASICRPCCLIASMTIESSSF